MVKENEFFLRYSPNHNARPARPVSLIVMHYTGMVSGEAALERLCNPESKVSAHYLVEEDGRVFALVEEDRRAWHAGVGEWRGQVNINDVSIGIEIVNPGHEHGYRPFPQPQTEAVRGLAQDIMRRHDIPAEGVVAHSDIAPARKKDPGEWFPWERLAGHGIGVWPGPASGETPLWQTEEAAAQLHAYGYMRAQTEEMFACVISAFQRHYDPGQVTGLWNGSAQVRLEALLARRHAHA